MTALGVWHKNLRDLPLYTWSNLNSFVNTKSAVKVTSDRGYKFFVEGYIHDFEVCTDKDSDSWALRAKCYRSQRKSEKPHQLKVHFRGVCEEHWSCSCAAGQHLCQHIVAVLHQLVHFQAMNATSVPHMTSKTSLPQAWHVPRRRDGLSPKAVVVTKVQKAKTQKSKRQNGTGVASTLYNAVQEPLASISLRKLLQPQFAAVQPQPQFLQLWGREDDQSMVDTPFGEVPKGSVLSYQLTTAASICDGNSITIPSSPPLPPFTLPALTCHVETALNFKEFNLYWSLAVTPEMSLEIETDTRAQSSTAKWHDVRKFRLTASNFKRIAVRKADFQSLSKQLSEKKGIQTQAMKRGVELEPKAAELYSKTFGRNVYAVGFVVNPSAFHLGASPDRRVYDPDAEEKFGLLEVKCPAAQSVSSCKYLQVLHGGDLRLKRNHEYYYQVMGQMGLTGCSWCDFFVFTSNDYHCERIYFDNSFFDVMKCQLDMFFFNHFAPSMLQQ